MGKVQRLSRAVARFALIVSVGVVIPLTFPGIGFVVVVSMAANCGVDPSFAARGSQVSQQRRRQVTRRCLRFLLRKCHRVRTGLGDGP